MSIFSYDDLEEQHVCAKDCQVSISEGSNPDDVINIHMLLDNYKEVLKSHMDLQERNESLRKANTSLVSKIKGVKYVLGLK